MKIYKKDKVGEIHESNNYGKVEIIEQISAKNMKIKFLEDGTILENKKYGSIIRGCVKNPCKREYYGVGYIGIGKYTHGNSLKAMKTWQNMMQRCYDIKYHEKYPTYREVTVCEEWKCFQNFAEWFENNYRPEFMKGWCLDKDLFSKDIKIYSPFSSCFLPQIINKLITHMHTTPIITDVKGRFYTKIYKGNKILRFSVFDTKEEAIFRYKEEKRNYCIEVLSQYKPLLPDNIVIKMQELIDLI
ncbi:MAG TPA: hypothetical protein VLA48_02940 [Nitrososphaeraceae archaeon]|nr:hypothetical protein [Nitrososphaeraceae archaeon]